MEVDFHASSDCHAVSAFDWSVLLGPLQWGFSERTWCRILPFIGYPSILIPHTIIIKDVTPASTRLCLFHFSLAGKAKQWFYKEKEAINT
jgi:hypothetical protein